jgi:hypothetical protein
MGSEGGRIESARISQRVIESDVSVFRSDL